jgi:hypothetical protein
MVEAHCAETHRVIHAIQVMGFAALNPSYRPYATLD